MKVAKYFETFSGYRYYKDAYGNIYWKHENEIAYCSNLIVGQLTEDKAEPYYPVDDIILVD